MTAPLIILSSHFGKNFSGGTLATHEIFFHLQHHFSKVIFLGKKVGIHQFNHLEFLPYRNVIDACQKLRLLRKSYPKAVFFGDFYMSYFFTMVGVQFFFAYHDNWPEMQQFGWKNRLRSRLYVPLYHRIISKAQWTFTVSDFKLSYVRKISDRSSLVRNGTSLDRLAIKDNEIRQRPKILMLGNIDDRKYGLAVAFFARLSAEGCSLEIHIHGHELDKKLGNQLRQFAFVKIHGFTNSLDWNQYDALLSTSKMENLAISVVEALKMGIPVFGFDVGGLKEVVKNDVNGFLAPLKQHSLLLDKLLRFEDFKHLKGDEVNLKEFDWKLASRRYQEKIFEHA